MNEPEYFYLNPLSSVIDENKIMIKTEQPFIGLGSIIYWEINYLPIKCYFNDIRIANINDYKIDKFFLLVHIRVKLIYIYIYIYIY